MRDAKPLDALDDCYFGACDKCGRPGTLRHVWYEGSVDNFIVCEECRTAWCLGMNVLTPPDEFWEASEQEHAAAAKRFFAEYRELTGNPPAWVEERLRRECI